MNQLEATEPLFYPYWRANQDEDDPQLERWIEREAQQLETGRRWVAEITEQFPVDGREVLDIGSQWGATCIALARAGGIVTGLDTEQALVDGARVRAREQGVEASFTQGFAEQLPFEDARFDCAVCLNVLEHVRDHRDTVREILRVLRPGGDLYINGPNRFAPFWLRSDPHYNLVGVSVLPHRLGELYITRVRGFPSYDVGTFPIAGRIERMLRESGGEIVASSRRPATSLPARAWESALFNVRRGMFWFHVRKR